MKKIFVVVVMIASSPFLGSKTLFAQVGPSVFGIENAVNAVGAVGTTRQQAWLNATLAERMKIAEELGDDGARAFAKNNGWSTVFDGLARNVNQGLDQVYGSANGVIHVVEAKGGNGKLIRAYGFVQGSSEWAVKSAQYVLSHSAASEPERRASVLVLEAASKGNLHVHVIRTPHVLGEPAQALLEQTVKCSDEAAQLAASGLKKIDRSPLQATDDVVRSSDDAARSLNTIGKALRAASKVAVPIAVAIDVRILVNDGRQIERQYNEGKISHEVREVAHAKNVGGMAGGLGGAAGGALIAAQATAPLAACSGPAAPWIEGGAVVAGGIVGYMAGEAAAEAAIEWTVDRVHATGTTIAESAITAWQGTVYAANATTTSIKGGWNWLRGK